MRRDDLLDLNDVLQHPGRRLEVDIETELENEGDLDLVRPLAGFLEAYSTGNLLILTGEFKTTAVVECSRCTGPLEQEVKFELDEQFPVEGTPSSFNAQDYARVVTEEPFPIFDGNNLIVENLLRQTLLLNMPLQPLCAYGWEGDCPEAKTRGVIGLSSPDDRPRGPLAALLALAELEANAPVAPDSSDVDPQAEDRNE